MTWEEAKSLIKQNISIETDINTERSSSRKILNMNHYCHNYDFKNEPGILVQIGSRTNIEIPWSMLEYCFAALFIPDGYNGIFFRKHYPTKAKQHPCHVHTVGMIFFKAGIAKMEAASGSYHLI